MREIESGQITETVKELFLKASFDLSPDILSAFEDGLAREESPVGKDILEKLLKNADLACRERIPLCQDTGMATIFVELGQEVHINGGLLNEAVTEGVRQAYQDGYLRKSMCHPLTRQNTGDNTPAVIHVEMTAGDKIMLYCLPKGGGSENMSRVHMLPPSAGWEGAKAKIIEAVSEAGPNPCPPLIIGVALGGSFDTAPKEAKKTLLRSIGQPNSDPDLAAKEAELLEAINNLGIGPSGLGGRITALAVYLTMLPCHIASMPLAINLQCHASRHAQAEI